MGIIWMDEFGIWTSNHFRWKIAKRTFNSRTDIGNVSLRVGCIDDLVNILDELTIFLFRGTQRFFYLLALRHFVCNPNDAVIEHWRNGGSKPGQLPINIETIFNVDSLSCFEDSADMCEKEVGLRRWKDFVQSFTDEIR